jgi:Tfp pilus assembly protein PilV
MTNGCRKNHGFALVEVALSTVFVSVLLLAALQAATLATTMQYRNSQRSLARFLADGLMTEILAESYEQPSGTVSFGRETGELATSKTNYNDVDDYNGWSESPPQDSTGGVLPNTTGWRRSVVVEWVDPLNMSTVAVTESGAKRVTVSVTLNNVLVAKRICVVTKSR